MLHYYSCYSIGGYKNLDLGNDSDTGKEVNYFLPLLPVWQKENRPNMDELIEKNNIKELDGSSNLPNEIVKMICFQGYKLLYRHLKSGQSVVSLRDIRPTSTTDSETNPFLFIVMSDSMDDVRAMDRIADYFAHNIEEVSQKICECLYYDSKECGLCFRNKKLNDWIKTFPAPNEAYPSNSVPLLVLERGSENYHFAEQTQGFILEPNSICFSVLETSGKLYRIPISESQKKKKSIILIWAVGILCLILLLTGGYLGKTSQKKLKNTSNDEPPTLQSKDSLLLGKDSTDFESFSSNSSTIKICPCRGKECPCCGEMGTCEENLIHSQIDDVE